MKYFLIVYDRLAGRVLDLREFEPTDRVLAREERFKRELLERGNANVEVALLAAPSLDSLKTTHSRYFHSNGDIAVTGG